MKTGVDPSPPQPKIKSQQQNNELAIRPIIVSGLAVLQYGTAVFSLILFCVAVSGSRPLSFLLKLLGFLDPGAFWYPDSLKERLIFSAVVAAFGLLSFLIGRGLWRLGNWARILMLVFYLIDLLPGRAGSSTLWPLSIFVGGNPFFELLSLIISFALILYLLSTRVRTAFGVTSKNSMLRIAVIALALVAIAITISKSRTEFKALAWHLHNGNVLKVNGVTFPLYSWYVPVQYDETGFEIDDRPGPFRPRDETAWISISGCPSSESMNPKEIVESKMRDVERSRSEVTAIDIQIGGQAMRCIQRGRHTYVIECYGTGPITSVHFVGGQDAVRRFKGMMAAAY